MNVATNPIVLKMRNRTNLRYSMMYAR